MNTLDEIKKDPEFHSRWPYIWNKLQKVLLEEQREFSMKNRGKHEEIGRYVEFMQQLVDKLNQVDAQVYLAQEKTPKHPRLHNVHLKDHAQTSARRTPEGV